MRFENRTWKISVRVIWAFLGASAIVGIAFGDDTIINFALDASGTTLFFFLFLKFAGGPSTQRFVEIGNEGIRYGKKYLVPWANLRSVEWKRLPTARKSHLVGRSSGWKPGGIFGRIIARQPLPLSSLDTRQPPSVWLEAIRRYAPARILQVPADP